MERTNLRNLTTYDTLVKKLREFFIEKNFI